MHPFFVQYTIGAAGYDVNESGTVDCGGPTKRLLSNAWFQYWDNMGVSSLSDLIGSPYKMQPGMQF